jgi:hypothetical protein
MNSTSASLLSVFQFPIRGVGSPADSRRSLTRLTMTLAIDIVRILRREFVSSLAVSQSAKVMVPALRHLIPFYVLRMGKKLQMCRIAALRCPAPMMDFQAFGDGTHQQFIGEAMNVTSSELPIALPRAVPRPEPASRWAHKNSVLHVLGQSTHFIRKCHDLSMAEKLCWGQFLWRAT